MLQRLGIILLLSSFALHIQTCDGILEPVSFCELSQFSLEKYDADEENKLEFEVEDEDRKASGSAFVISLDTFDNDNSIDYQQMYVEYQQMHAEYQQMYAEYQQMCAEYQQMCPEYKQVCEFLEKNLQDTDALLVVRRKKIYAKYQQMCAESQEMCAKSQQMYAEYQKMYKFLEKNLRDTDTSLEVKKKQMCAEYQQMYANYQQMHELLKSNPQNTDDVNKNYRKTLYSKGLFIACYKGDVKRVEELLEKNPQYAVPANEDGWTPLMVACIGGADMSVTTQMIDLLYEKRAQLDACTLDGLTISKRVDQMPESLKKKSLKDIVGRYVQRAEDRRVQELEQLREKHERLNNTFLGRRLRSALQRSEEHDDTLMLAMLLGYVSDSRVTRHHAIQRSQEAHQILEPSDKGVWPSLLHQRYVVSGEYKKYKCLND